MRRLMLVCAAAMAAAAGLSAKTLRVPADQATIQGAINAAAPGDTVLVSEGTYEENINFRGKSIVVTSRYLLTQNPQTILQTIIDGRNASNLDSASTVLFVSGEDSASVLQGFTITGGSGSKYVFSGMGAYQEGGGIMLSGSSATIRDNVILRNRVKGAGVIADGGGGGISSMYGNPTIVNNIVAANTAPYAAGIVLNFSGGKVRNNILLHNVGGSSFGTGGIMIWKVPANAAFVENNTIVGNVSVKDAGGINITIASAWPTVRNNVVWRNRQVTGGQVLSPDRTSYNLLEDYAGGSNFSQNPLLLEHSLMPSATSPCVDAGDTAASFSDCLFPPSQGSARNDVGASGGPFARLLPELDIQDLYLSANSVLLGCKAGAQARGAVEILNPGSASVTIDSLAMDGLSVNVGGNFVGRVLGPLERDSIILTAAPTAPGSVTDTLRVFHHIPGIPSPARIVVKLTVAPATGVRSGAAGPNVFRLSRNYPNPFNPSTRLTFSLPESAVVSLVVHDVLGREVAIVAQGQYAAGVHTATWNASHLASGVYVALFSVMDRTGGVRHCESVAMLLMK